MTDATADKDNIEYRSLKTGDSEWTVFVVDDRKPEWWRVVAKFLDQGRASAYAEFENMRWEFTEDHAPDNHFGMVEAGEGVEHAPALDAPASALSHFVRRETLTHTRIEREETVTIPPAPAAESVITESAPRAPRLEAPRNEAPEAVEVAAELPHSEENDPEPTLEMVDAETLDPLTAPQLLAFNVLRDANGSYVSTKEMIDRSGNGGVPTAVYALVKKGYVVADADALRRKIYRIVCVGEPKCYDAPNSAIRAPDAPATDASASAEHVDAEDLSKSPSEVLCVVDELYGDKIHPIKEPQIRGITELDEKRVSLAVTRLLELNLIRRDGNGSFFPTKRGSELAEEIRKIEREAT